MLTGLLITSLSFVACTSSAGSQDSQDPQGAKETPTLVLESDEHEVSPVSSQAVKIDAGNYPSYLAASVTRARNGDILVFTRVGANHAASKGKIVLFRSSDDGVTWGDAGTVAEDPVYDCRNPITVTLPSGRILLGYAVYGYQEGLATQPNRIVYSDDNGKTWSTLSTVAYPPYFASAGNIMIVPSTGVLLLPCEDTTVTPWRAVILLSTDGGVTWVECASFSLPEYSFNEPTLAYADNGKLYCVVRDDASWHYWVLESVDNGESWSEPVPYPQMTGSQPSLTRVGNYLILLSRDELTPGTPGTASTGLTFYSSTDGTTWWGKKYLWMFSPVVSGFHASYGSTLPLSGDTFSVFFSVEKVGWFDSGVYCLPLALNDITFQGKSLPVIVLNVETLSPGATSSLGDSRVLTLENVEVLTLTVEVTYHALATAGTKVHIYSSYDGLVYDTEELKDARGSPVFGDVPFTPKEVVRMTKDVVFGSRYIRVAVENGDQNQPVTGVKVMAVVSR